MRPSLTIYMTFLSAKVRGKVGTNETKHFRGHIVHKRSNVQLRPSQASEGNLFMTFEGSLKGSGSTKGLSERSRSPECNGVNHILLTLS